MERLTDEQEFYTYDEVVAITKNLKSNIRILSKKVKDCEACRERFELELKRADKNYLDLKNEFDDRLEASKSQLYAEIKAELEEMSALICEPVNCKKAECFYCGEWQALARG